MRRKFDLKGKELALSVLTVLALFGCQKKELECQVSDSKPFTAVIEDNYSADTKTSLDEYGNVLWKKGDQVSIFAGSTINEQYQVTDASDGRTSAGLNRVTSPGFNAGGEIDNNVAFYPYASTNDIVKNASGYTVHATLPTTQIYADSSFGSGAYPMAAVTSSTSDMNLKFKNVLGGLKIQLKGTASITSVSVSGNNDEILCGTADVAVSSSSAPSVTMTGKVGNTVTLDCGEGVQLDALTATSFIIALPPLTMTGGFTVTVVDTDGMQMEIKTTKSQTITRSSVLKMPEVTYKGTPVSPERQPFTITSIGDTHVSIIKEGSPDPITLEYKVGEGSWSSYTVDSEIILSDKQPVKFRAGNGGNPHFSKDDRNFYRVVVSGEGQINISGNIMSLLNGELLTNSLPDYCFRGLFSSCAALVDASTLILPATELSSHCYARMFGSCSNLISAPILPATTLADYCYYWMFRYCSALTSAPELPATTLAEHCYDTMFLGCSSLSSAPDLPATTLADNCYSTMFSGCTGLTSAPELHASTLADNCYSSMFSGCRNLVSAPELPASTLAKGCYQSMFSNCQSLVSAPELPAEILVDNCYSSMFLNCMYLKYIKMLATDVSAEGCLFNWVSQVYPSGTFVKSKEAIWDNFGECGIPPFWTVICDDGTPVKPEVDKPFTISSSGNTSLSISKIGSPEDVLLEYKKGNGDWEPYIIGSEIYINEYMSVQFRAGENGNTHFSQSLGDYYHLTTAGDGLIKATGNIMSLLDRDMHAESLSGYCFYNFFGQCSQLCDASTLSLPASTLAHYCYANMFDECSNLSFAPELPALTLAYMCYEKMFRKCTNLITAPKLPATTLASNCYKRMFMGCKGLINAPELPATSLAGACYCCMFVDCTNLVNAPVLPATTLEEVCYESMFLGCSNLQYIKMLATDISAQRCLENWVSEVSASGTFVKNAAATWSNEDVVPSGWTVITE